MVLSYLSVHASVCASCNIVNMISCSMFDTFSQNVCQRCIMGRGECVTIWGRNVKGQGHGRIKYAGNSTFWVC